jgi:predicted dehydrogenase
MQQFRIGLIGTGFMGRAHSNAYGQGCKFFELIAICIIGADLGKPQSA